ncbi:MAG: amidohydrolase [Lautropia sp.]
MTPPSPSDTRGLIVDSHAHVFKLDMPLVPNPRHSPNYSFTARQYLDVLDEHGVRFAVLAAASPWGDCNDYMIETVRAHPRLRGTVILQPSVERAILDAMHADGIVGVRLPFISMREPPDLDTWDWRKFLYRLRELDWHVHLHSEGARLPRYLPALERSGVKIVIDHIGRPDPATGVDGEGFAAMVASVQRGRTWVKMSGAYRVGPKATHYAQTLIGKVGCDRLVWGSDCPFVGEEGKVTYRQTMDWLVEAIPDEAQRRRVFGENALELYFS